MLGHGMISIAFFGGSIALGLALGAAFVLVWRIFLPRGATGRMASELVTIAKDLTQTDAIGEFGALYKRLLVSAGGYLARNLGGLLLACLPMVLVLVFLAPPALEAWERRAEGFAVYPPLETEDIVLPLNDAPTQRTAICWSETYCALFGLLGFEVHDVPDPHIADVSYVVIRPSHADGNFLWPFLNDLEFAFLIAFMAATVATFMLPGRRA